MTRKASVLILNYNGKDLLDRYLPSVVEAVKYDNGSHEIIVVDNASTDNTIDFVKQNFPQVKIRKIMKIVKNKQFHEIQMGFDLVATATTPEITAVELVFDDQRSEAT